MKSNPVGWFEIYVQDMPRATRFYEAVFKCKLQSMESPGVEMMMFPMDEKLIGSAGSLVRMKGAEPGGSGTIVYFTCDDCAKEEGRVAAAGGEVHKTKESIGEHGFISLVKDSEGNMIGLHSRK